MHCHLQKYWLSGCAFWSEHDDIIAYCKCDPLTINLRLLAHQRALLLLITVLLFYQYFLCKVSYGLLDVNVYFNCM